MQSNEQIEALLELLRVSESSLREEGELSKRGKEHFSGWADVVACAADAIRQLQTDRQWQPIETAPKDGTPFLWTNEGRSAVINWQEYDGCFSSGSWMPLPPPPAAIQLSSPVTVPTSAPAETFRDAPFAPEMVMVPAGKFMMGSPVDELDRCDDEGPQHEVTIAKPFAIGVYPVTRGEFAEFVSATNYDAGDRWRDPGFAQDDSHPVVCVSWDDAKAYAAWLSQKTGKSYRLPSEAEWEYVCRAGTTTPFWWGASITPAQANYDAGVSKGECRKRTMPVDSFDANPWGLYQVHGNVWEWCEDCWNENYSGVATDGSAWTTGDGGLRVLRGASWDNITHILRSAYRDRYATGDLYDHIGFRLART